MATTISPVVSLSSRCTMPGRLTPPMPDRLSPQCAISALTSVPVAWPGAGCTTRPGRFVDDDDLVVLEDDIERDALAAGLGRLRLRHRHRDGFGQVDAIARIADRAVADRDRAVEDQRLEARARQAGARRRERGRAAGRAARRRRRPFLVGWTFPGWKAAMVLPDHSSEPDDESRSLPSSRRSSPGCVG